MPETVIYRLYPSNATEFAVGANPNAGSVSAQIPSNVAQYKDQIIAKLKAANVYMPSDLRGSVRAWQAKFNRGLAPGTKGIGIDGVVGNQTLTAMGIASAVRPKGSSSPGSSGGGLSGPRATIMDAMSNISKYTRSPAMVRTLQAAFNDYAAAVPGAPRIKVDGIWGKNSRSALDYAKANLK